MLHGHMVTAQRRRAGLLLFASFEPHDQETAGNELREPALDRFDIRRQRLEGEDHEAILYCAERLLCTKAKAHINDNPSAPGFAPSEQARYLVV